MKKTQDKYAELLRSVKGMDRESRPAYINQWLERNSLDGLSLDEIGTLLGITRERVRQIEASAIKKLKHPKVAIGLRSYLQI